VAVPAHMRRMLPKSIPTRQVLWRCGTGTSGRAHIASHASPTPPPRATSGGTEHEPQPTTCLCYAHATPTGLHVCVPFLFLQRHQGREKGLAYKPVTVTACGAANGAQNMTRESNNQSEATAIGHPQYSLRTPTSSYCAPGTLITLPSSSMYSDFFPFTNFS